MNLDVDPLTLRIEPASRLSDYASIPIAFEVNARLVLPLKHVGPCRFKTVPVDPYLHDYDRLPGQNPTEWAARWNLADWCLFGAFIGQRRVGGAALILNSSEVEGPAHRPGTALLWDLRVHPNRRGQGIGAKLLAFAEAHARANGLSRMRVETQDTNPAACRLYARAGYALVSIDPNAYPDVPGQVQLIWEMALVGTLTSGHRVIIRPPEPAR